VNVLCLDATQSFLNFALRCMSAGHYVRVCMAADKETKQPSKVGDGLVEKIKGEEWQPHMNWADLVITSDNVKWLRELDVYRQKGYPIFGPSFAASELELNRGKGQEFLRKNGINIIEYETFSDYRKAEAYVREHADTTFVCKPDGDKDKALSYVAKSAKDMLYMLRRWAELNRDKQGRFMLQEKIEGVEFGVAGWLGSKGFAPYFEEFFEHKKLMNEDYGPNTGEMGTCCKYVEDSQLAKEMLLPLERELIKIGCTGSVAVGAMIDENGDPRPLEFTMRLGWPSFNICQSLHPEPCEWMVNLIDGKNTFVPSNSHATGVVMAIPPFPYPDKDEKKVSGIPIWHLDPKNEYRDYLAPSDVMLGMAPNDRLEDERCMVSCGDYLVVATGVGDSVRESARNSYKAVKSLEIPNDVIVRTDVGDIEKDLSTLQGQGFATDWTY
jgi:phosphoribosylamine--glycine ligase